MRPPGCPRAQLRVPFRDMEVEGEGDAEWWRIHSILSPPWVRIQPLSPGPQQTLGLCSSLGGSGCSSPRPEPDWQVCLCEPSRPRLPRAQCWTLATGHWPAGSWCRPARVSHIAPRHSNDFLLLGPSTREQQLQVGWQSRFRQAPRRAGGVLTGKRGASVGHHRPHLKCTLTGQRDQGSMRLGKSPRTRGEALTDQQAQHVQQHEDPPPLHVAPAQGRPRPPLAPAVPAAPGSHGRGDCPTRERAGLDERAGARRRRGWERAWHEEKVRRREGRRGRRP